MPSTWHHSSKIFSRSGAPLVLAGVALAVVTVGAGGVADAGTTDLTSAAGTGPAAVGEPILPSVGTNFSATGPFATTSTVSGTTTYYYPTTAATDGIKHPVIIWGNGSGADTSTYSGLLKHFASHGFIVAAANTTSAGTGVEMLAGIDGIARVAAIAGAADLTRVGATGHSLGAGGSLKAAADPRVRTAFPLEGGMTRPTGLAGKTVAYFEATGDTVIKSDTVKANSFDTATDYAAAFVEFKGGTHGTPIDDKDAYRAAVTAWARWQLADDANAKPLFVGDKPGLAGNPAWARYLINEGMKALYP
jgi:Chlorophyllase enzyme